ncbi:MAG TPA: hypothetical protein VGD98_17110 [Ktedonobacteraceae bacterium]
MHIQTQAYPDVLSSLSEYMEYVFREVRWEIGIPQQTLFAWTPARRAVLWQDSAILARLPGYAVSKLALNLLRMES